MVAISDILAFTISISLKAVPIKSLNIAQRGFKNTINSEFSYNIKKSVSLKALLDIQANNSFNHRIYYEKKYKNTESQKINNMNINKKLQNFTLRIIRFCKCFG